MSHAGRCRPGAPRHHGPALLVVLVAAGAGAAAGEDPARFDVGPAGAWVVEERADLDAPPPEREVRSGVFDVLIDRQYRAGEGGTETYDRRVRRILTTAGVQAASELTMEFDPSFERLTIHHVRIVRDGRVVDALEPSQVKVIQQEAELEQRIYNGNLTALVFLEDVRAGDSIDWAYTRTGANPVLGGRFAAAFPLGGPVPARCVRVRVVWPRDRTLHSRTHGLRLEPTVEEAGELRIHEWRIENARAIEVDESIPEWFAPWPWLQLSEFATWGEVAAWAGELFAAGGAPRDAVRSRARQFEKVGGREARVLAAVRFVQDEVRYLGIELGPSSHQPHGAEQVLLQRFGDCKDKAGLLIALLAEMGIDAVPALVNTSMQRTLDQALPSPFVFDHVVVRFDIDGVERWVDATASHQGGGLSAMGSLPYERALIARAGSTGLVAIPEVLPAEPTTVVEERYTSASFDAPAELRVAFTYRGGDADAARARMAASSPAELAREDLDFQAREHAGAEVAGEARIEDDREANVVTVSRSYRLPLFWRDGKSELRAWAVAGHLDAASASHRTMPLAVPHPVHVRHRMVLELPIGFPVEEGRLELADAGLAYARERRASGTTIELDHVLESLGDAVPAEAAAEHALLRMKMRDDAGFTLTAGSAVSPLTAAQVKVGLAVCALLVGVATGVPLVRRLVEARRRRVQARLVSFSPGFTPGAAILVGTVEEMEERARTLRCPCGAPGGRNAAVESLHLGARRLMRHASRCDVCGQSRDLYFELSPDRNAVS